MQEIASQLLIIIAALVVVVNIITEVVKNVFEFKDVKSINIFVTILSVAFTFTVAIGYWQIKQWEITCYVCIAFVVVGFMVAYAAMFGFDKLIKYFEQFK